MGVALNVLRNRPRSMRRSAELQFGLYAGVAAACLAPIPALAQSLVDPQVRAGGATVTGLGTTNVVVTQTTDKAIIDWRKFSVDAGSGIVFAQPNSNAIALNRVTGSDATRIEGSLTANGQVWLLNPNGVLIGAGGRVGVGGLLATTGAISNADFMAGNYRFTGANGAVENRGAIVADGGYAILAGGRVANSGLVQARLGQVVLGAGGGYALDVAGDRLLSFAVTGPVAVVAGEAALVDNSGTLSAAGGKVLLTARAAADVVGNVVNTSGTIQATAARAQGGTIVLDGGEAGLVQAGGLIDASGKAIGQTGGTVGVFGENVVVGANARVDASGYAGGGTINVGGGWQGASIDGRKSAIRAGVAAGAVLDASAIAQGNGGEITLWSDVNDVRSQTYAAGTFLARGGATGGDGGRIETSGRYLDAGRATGSAAAPAGKAGTWLFDPYDVEIVASSPFPNIVNPGFENGLTGWTVIGQGGMVQVVTSAQGSGPGGSQIGGPTFTSPVSAGGNFALATGGNTGSGVGVTQTFTGNAGDAFDVHGLFLGKDYLPFDDVGAITITRPDGTSQTLYRKDITAAGNYGSSPWEQVRYTLPATGSYTVTATLTNVRDASLSSQLGFEIAAGTNSQRGAFANTTAGQTWTPNGASSKVDAGQITGFLDAGTNVRITTGTADTGNQAGNITVNAAIIKSGTAVATLQLDANNAITVNSPIRSLGGALDVQLNAGAGGIALNATINTAGGTLGLNTTGTATQAVTIVLGANTLQLGGTGGVYELVGLDNRFQRVTGSTGAVTLTNNAATEVAGLTTSGRATVSSVGLLTLSGASSFGTDSTLASAGAITIAAGSTIATTGRLALQAQTSFSNLAGAGAITTSGAGRWVIYSQNPADNVFGGLASGNTAIWGRTSASLSPDATTGNRYVFAQSPELTVKANDANKTYGDALGTTGRPVTITGLVDAAQYGNVFTQDTVSGSAAVSSAGDGAGAFVGTYTQTASQGTLTAPAGYTVAYANGTLTVDPRALYLAAANADKVYDGTTASGTAPTATGLANGDTVSGLAQQYDSRNAGARTLTVANGYVVNDGNGGRNYTVTTGTATGTITPKALTASLTGSTGKTYDGTTSATLAANNYGLSGAVAGDTVALNNPTAGTYADRNVGTGKTVSVGGLALTGADAGNYTVNANAAGAIGSISPKQLTAALTGSTAKTYDGTTSATLATSNYGLSGAVEGDAVALNNPTAGTYADRNVGTSKTVSVGGLALTGADAGNYTVNAAATGAIGAISPKALTAALTGSTAKTYDGTTGATLAASNYGLSGAVAGDAVALNNPTAGTYADRNVGTGKTVSVGGLALTGADAGNYTVNANAAGAIGAISPKALTAALTGSTAKTYDGTTGATLAANNYGLSGAVAGDAVALNDPTVGTYADRNVGTSKTVSVGGLALTGADAGNYTVNAAATGAIGAISPKALTAALTGSTAKTYDGTTSATLAANNYGLSGAVAGDAVGLNNPTAGTYADRNVGTGKTVSVGGLALTGADAGNYTVNAAATGAIGSIAARQLAAALVGSTTKVFDGSTAATLTAGNFAVSGFVAGEGASVLATAGTYATANAGGDIAVTSTLGAGDFAANSGTLLSNYVLPTGSVSARIGVITPQVIVPTTPATPATPAPTTTVVAAAASTAAASVLPPVSATPTAPAAAAPAAPAPVATGTVTITAGTPVAPSPPSPVAAAKPATPTDPVDAADPILAAVEPPKSEAPVAGGFRQDNGVTVISAGLLSQQRANDDRSEGVPGVDDVFSGSGGSF